MLGAGIIEDVRVQREKGFGFVRYRTHEEAAYAIQAANGRIMGGKSVKVYVNVVMLLIQLSRIKCWKNTRHTLRISILENKHGNTL